MAEIKLVLNFLDEKEKPNAILRFRANPTSINSYEYLDEIITQHVKRYSPSYFVYPVGGIKWEGKQSLAQIK